MKKLCKVILSVLMILSLVSCSKSFSPEIEYGAYNQNIKNITEDVRFFNTLGEDGYLKDEILTLPVIYSVTQECTVYVYSENGLSEMEIPDDESQCFTVGTPVMTCPLGYTEKVSCYPITISKCLPGDYEVHCRYVDELGKTFTVPLSIQSAETCLYYCEEKTFTKDMVFSEGTYHIRLYTISGDQSSNLKYATNQNGTWSSSFLGMDLQWNPLTQKLTVNVEDTDKAILNNYFITYTADNGIQYVAHFTVE